MKATRISTTQFVLVVLLMLAGARFSHAAWPTAHGSPGNTGFARVDTLPAAVPIGFADVGRVAPGANPVTGPDGTVYIGNLAGEFIALYPDGRPYWKRTIYPGQGKFFSSPVVGVDGSVYAVSAISYLDHHGNATIRVHSTFLHKFLPGGGWTWTAFPTVDNDGGVTTAPPNRWVWNGSEAIMTPVVYKGRYGTELRLIAFSTSGAVLANQRVTFQAYDITAEGDSFLDGLIDALESCFLNGTLGCAFSPGLAMSFDEAGWPQPGVAIWEYPQGSPWVWVADGIRSTVAYKFDPAKGFSEIYRFSDTKDRLSSPPVALDNVIAAVGTSDGRLKFERENVVIAGFSWITAAPTRMNDGRLVVIERNGKMSVINLHSVVLQQQLNGESIASAAASCTHLFVSTTNELVTFDVKTMLPVARVPWTDGGRNAPIIGPLGHVYAMTNFGLFVFAAPRRLPISTAFATACDQPMLNGGGVVLR